jgi:cysteinyl-tRNA synthetase
LTQEEEALIRRREQARTRKEWAEADQLRTALEARGIRLLDTLSGPLWERID